MAKVFIFFGRRLKKLVEDELKIVSVLLLQELVIVGVHFLNYFDYAFNVGLVVKN